MLTVVGCAYLRAGGGLLHVGRLALVGHAGRLLLAELDVSVSCVLVEPPLTVGTLDIVYR